MKYICTVISVTDINAARKFYENMFGLEVYQDYGKNIAFTCGLALQQDFDWLVLAFRRTECCKNPTMRSLCSRSRIFDGFLNKLKEYPDIECLGEVIEHSWGQRVIRFYDLDRHLIEVGEDMKMVVKRFLNTGMTMEEVSKRMDVSIGDLEKLLNS